MVALQQLFKEKNVFQKNQLRSRSGSFKRSYNHGRPGLLATDSQAPERAETKHNRLSTSTQENIGPIKENNLLVSHKEMYTRRDCQKHSPLIGINGTKWKETAEYQLEVLIKSGTSKNIVSNIAYLSHMLENIFLTVERENGTSITTTKQEILLMKMNWLSPYHVRHTA